MKNKTKYFFLFFVVILLVAGVYYFTQKPENYVIPRTLRYSLEVQNTTNKMINEASLWVYGPAKQTSFQLTKSLTASLDFELTADALGNQIMEFKIQNLPPFGTKVINIESQLLLANKPQKINLDDKTNFLKSEPFIEVEHQDIQKKAQELAKSSNKETLLNSYKWVSNHIKYSGFIKDDRGALYALKNRLGDCTEYAHLQTAMARANQIASRSVGGYIVSEDAVLKASDYHNWTEAYINSMWRTVDAQNKRYMDKESDYIVFRILGRSVDERLSNTHRFAYSDKNLNVKMY